MKGYLHKYLGPSIYLLILDLFLENPGEFYTLTEVSRRIGKKPGSVSPILPYLVEKELLNKKKVGKVSFVYYLNLDNQVVSIFRDTINRIEMIA